MFEVPSSVPWNQVAEELENRLEGRCFYKLKKIG